MEKLVEFLYLPALAAAVAALVMYVLEKVHKRRAIRVALEAEINSILADVRANLEFLQRDDHYWLQVGQTIPYSPRPFEASTRIYAALLPELPLLGSNDLRRVLAFYGYYEVCENLRSSLFAHVGRHAEAGSPLTPSDVAVLRKRRDRLCTAYRNLDSRLPRVVGLRHLKKAYQLPSHQELASTIGTALQTGGTHRPIDEE